MTRSQFLKIGFVISILLNSIFLFANSSSSTSTLAADKAREGSFSDLGGSLDAAAMESYLKKAPKKRRPSQSKKDDLTPPGVPAIRVNAADEKFLLGDCSTDNLKACNQTNCINLNTSLNSSIKLRYYWDFSCNETSLEISNQQQEEAIDESAPVVGTQLTQADCTARLAEAELACYESKTSAVSSCNYSESETAESVKTATSQISAVVQQMSRGNLGTAGSLGSISNMTLGAKAALAGMQGKCSYDRNSCINTCSAAKKVIEACRGHKTIDLAVKNNEKRIDADVKECGDLENSLQAMDTQMAELLTAANGLTNICEQASYKNNPICTNGSLAGLNSTSGVVDCFANPSHSSCQVAPGTSNKLNAGLATLPTATTNGRGGAGIVGGLSGGGDGADYGNFKLNNDSNLKDVKVPSAKMLPGDGGGGGMGGGGAGGALGGGSGGSSAAGGNNTASGAAGSDLDLNFAKLNGDDTIARRMGMGSSGGAGAKNLPYQRDKNGNLIYPDARNLKFNMNRFRPSLGGGRGIAGGNTLGPDGITDGNSDLWKKINIQYNSQEDTLD